MYLNEYKIANFLLMNFLTPRILLTLKTATCKGNIQIADRQLQNMELPLLRSTLSDNYLIGIKT